ETLVSTLQANPKHLIAGCNCYIDHVPAGVRDPNAVPGPYQPTSHQKLIHEFQTVTVKGDVYALGILAAVFPVSQICSLFDTIAAREVFDHYIEFENPYGFDFSRRAYGNDVSFLSELALRSGELVQVGEPLVVCRASPDSMTVNAQRHHRWQYWLQYVWAIRSAWTRCRSLSPRMDALIGAVDARVSLCDTFYSLERRQWPREGNLFKIIRAVWFLVWQDRRLRKSVSPQSIGRWLGD
ncbi:MAG TPA: hypothetical protein VK968_17940, partial [Roseimicrobium sp.]|nr:hypothetical protein [Roseimicrobium sp.]